MPRSRPDPTSLPNDYLEPLVNALADPAVLAGIRPEELEPVTFQLALYFGVRRDPATSAALGGVYDRLVAEVPADAREVLVQDLATAITGGASSVLALLPALQRERDAGVARSAALAFATRMEAGEDGLAGPRAVRTLVDHADSDAVRAGLVGALLALGDPRVKPLIAGLWRALSPPARDALLALGRPLATRLETEWLLDWLEDAEPATFNAVAASLARLPAEGEGRVLELARELPATPAGAALTVAREWPAAALGASLTERFMSLARRAEPGAFDAVLVAWGVKR
jgi:hypothetical protein